MWLRWLPWRYVISRLARSRGFIDPVAVLSRLHRFAQPSEVAEPIELLRAGMVFHARGLINTRAIQHNLDWVWPYWVERQFNPLDESFVPRAFSITHVNLTQRNWTAVGVPDCDQLPIVDPAGLLTPIYDGWSLDCWIVPDRGPPMLPSKIGQVEQRLLVDGSPRVETTTRRDGVRLVTACDAVMEETGPAARLRAVGSCRGGGWLVVSLRPVNPEGVSFIHRVSVSRDGRSWRIGDPPGRRRIEFDQAPDDVHLSEYRRGDVLITLDDRAPRREIECDVGLATGAAMFRLEDSTRRTIEARVPLRRASRGGGRPGGTGVLPVSERRMTAETAVPPAETAVPPAKTAVQPAAHPISAEQRWRDALRGACQVELPDAKMQGLYDVALRTLILHSPGEDVYPGPYTYKRFWVRDAAFILDAMLCAGLTERAWRVIECYPDRQQRSGYFRSQEGEWDSNGQAIWTIKRFLDLTGQPLSPRLREAALRGAGWIRRKRLSRDLKAPHAGLLPAGFSAEHLGPNDYYYWDDFWSVAGLECASMLLGWRGSASLGAGAPQVESPTDGRDVRPTSAEAGAFAAEARDLRRCIDRSIESSASRRERAGVPASPYRRMDAGAIGSLAAAYPLSVWSATDPRLLATVEFLLENCFVHGGFFQDMIHSGINPYLTLHVAQVLMRAGDARFYELLETVAKLASPTGQWPEAIHPHTGGGCMGDGQHVWAAAEWLLFIRHCFVREEGDGLTLASGVAEPWRRDGATLRLGATPTRFGPVSVRIEVKDDALHVLWDGQWRGRAPTVRISPPGVEPIEVAGDQGSAVVELAPQETAQSQRP